MPEVPWEQLAGFRDFWLQSDNFRPSPADAEEIWVAADEYLRPLKQRMADLVASGADPSCIAYFTGELIDDHHALIRHLLDFFGYCLQASLLAHLQFQIDKN